MRRLQRRSLLSGTALLLGTVALSACGFKLRSAPNFAFQTIAVTPETGGAVATDVIRYFGDAIRPLAPAAGALPPDVILDIQQELREKSVVGVNATGQVREFQVRIRLRFRVRTPRGVELIAPTEIVQQRDISFNESAALAKEVEEGLLYRDMQNDIVQQLLRRLAAIKSLQP
jgi:LPS-assembly lipoprotein